MKFALLPVKDPLHAKQRLASVLSPEQREELARAMFQDVLAQLMKVSGLDRVVVASSDAAILMTAAGAGAMTLQEDAQSGHSHSADQGMRQLIEWGADSLLLIPGDVPMVQAAEIETLLEADELLPAPSLVIVPDLAGTGTNAMVRTPPDFISSSFGPGSLKAHLADARAAGAAVKVLRPHGLVYDLDTPDDARALLARGWSGPSADMLRRCLQGAHV